MIDEQRYRALIQQLATGGITGNNNYMNGGGVGSMMQPRMNFAGGGMDYEPLGYQDEGIEVQDLTLPPRVRAGFRGAGGSSTDGNLERNVFSSIDAAPEIMEFPGVNTIEGSLIDGDDITSRYDVQKDFPTNGIGSLPSSAAIAAALGSTGSNQLEGYQDMIMNPEGFPNALQNLERYQDNRFEDLEFQEGFNFIDAPNKVSNLKELYQNRNFMDNPRTGFFDNTIMSKGNSDASLINKAKNGIGGLRDFLPFGDKSLTGMAVKGLKNFGNKFNNPNAPKYMNYDPTGKIDYSKLNTNNLNDFYDDNPESETYGTTRFDRAKPGSFGSFRTLADYFNRNKNIKNTGIAAATTNKKIAAEKKAQEDIKAAERQTELNRRQSIANAQAARGQTTSGGAGNYRSDRDNSRAGGYGGSGRASRENRSSDLGFSDIRLKDNIELVGKSPSDINIYNFTYLNDPKVYQGVMAQEVPWASVKHNSGYLMVDYSKVDVDFKLV